MTTVYFVRHAQPDSTIRDDNSRPLTEEGLKDSLVVSEVLADKNIDIIYSSPYKRSMDTVRDFSEKSGLFINTDYDLREREAGGWHGDNFLEFIKNQWADFSYHIMDGECLNDVQKRNISALHKILDENKDKRIVIATHGTAMSTILNYYYPQFDAQCFFKIVDFMPFVLRVDFEGVDAVGAGVELIIKKTFKRK